MDEGTREQAQQMLAAAGRAEAAVRTEAWRYPVFLLGLGHVSAAWFVSLGWLSGTDGAVLASAGVFGTAVAGLCIGLLPRSRVSRRGFNRRFSAAMLGWAAAFSIGLAWGLVAWREAPGYWLSAAACVLLPALAGAYAERRSGDDTDA